MFAFAHTYPHPLTPESKVIYSEDVVRRVGRVAGVQVGRSAAGPVACETTGPGQQP